MAENNEIERSIKYLLSNPQYSKRTFETLKKRFAGLADDELRKFLLGVGAVSFRGPQNQELWGFNDQNMSRDFEQKSIHEKYWGHIFGQIRDSVLKHKGASITIVIVMMLIILASLGYARYIPELSTPVGVFSVEGFSANPASQKLDRSIFDLAKEARPGVLTSKQRVDLIASITGLQTNEEIGTIEDIGTDGSTILIRGNSSDGSVIGIVRCDFSRYWKQRLSLLKKDDTIKFVGTVSEYDLAQEWIVLKGCSLLKLN